MVIDRNFEQIVAAYYESDNKIVYTKEYHDWCEEAAQIDIDCFIFRMLEMNRIREKIVRDIMRE